MKHSTVWVNDKGETTMGDRPVHMFTLSDDVKVDFRRNRAFTKPVLSRPVLLHCEITASPNRFFVRRKLAIPIPATRYGLSYYYPTSRVVCR